MRLASFCVLVIALCSWLALSRMPYSSSQLTDFESSKSNAIYMRTYATVVIVLQTNAAGSFAFTENIPGCNVAFSFTAPGTKQVRCELLDSATYTATETSPGAGWAISVSCSESPPVGAASSASGPTATIRVDQSETVTCTFVNTYTPPVVFASPASLIPAAPQGAAS